MFTTFHFQMQDMKNCQSCIAWHFEDQGQLFSILCTKQGCHNPKHQDWTRGSPSWCKKACWMYQKGVGRLSRHSKFNVCITKCIKFVLFAQESELLLPAEHKLKYMCPIVIYYWSLLENYMIRKQFVFLTLTLVFCYKTVME